MGGAAGHMAHPFDLPWVNSGSDLLDFFDRAKTFVEKKGAGAVKIDGVNVSFKVVGDDDVKQFAVDRGSLEELGMWNDPSRFLNTEYVEGTTNVTQYDDNFLAIHGLNQFYHRIGKSGAAKGIERPGMQRPEGTKAASVEVPYEPAIMESLVEKLRPHAEEYGFKVYSSVPTERLGETEIDFAQALSEPFTVRVSDDREITKSLGEWLQEASNPRYKTVQLKDGNRTHPLHKQLYMNILNNSTPIVDLIDDMDAEAAIYGAIFMHATRMLGNEILRGLTSPMGDVMSHEGVVLRDDKLFGPNPVKVTGEFIVGNMGGGFGQVNEQEDEEEESIELDVIDSGVPDAVHSDAAGKTIAVVPGAFKPPHRGHLAMVEQYAAENDEVKVLISNPLKQQRTLEDGTVITAIHAKAMWDLLTGNLDNVTVEISDAASPLTAAYEFIGDEGPLQPGDIVTLGASRKGDDWKRWLGAEKYVKDGVEFKNPHSTAVEPTIHGPEYMGILQNSPLEEEMPSVKDSERDPRRFHASDMRYLLGKAKDDAEAVELLEDFVGGEGEVMEFLSLLGVDTGLNEPLEEVTGNAASAGAVTGGAGKSEGPFGPSLSTAGKKKKKKKKTENIDMSLVKEVYELLIERGILS
jgi:cytidyltransferase-like protein